MKRIAFVFLLAGLMFLPSAHAQDDHVQIGAYADYFRLSQTKTNFAGLGARLGFTAYHNLKFEAEMSYDFDQAFNEDLLDTGTGSITVVRSNTRVLHGLFGPKLELGHSNFHPFLTVKGGFVNFRLDSGPANPADFVSSIENLRNNNWMGTLYPGGGLEGHLGPVGLRLDVGDEMYFNGGTHHNLRVAFGPYIRF